MFAAYNSFLYALTATWRIRNLTKGLAKSNNMLT